MVKQISIKTKFGWISAFEVKNVITEVKFGKYKSIGKSKNLKKFKLNLKKYFSKKSKFFNINTKVDGNFVQKKIWNELKKIKFGQTKTYGEIAKKNKLSPRHIGKICSQNKILLAIPCHRVVRSDGTMGGFSAKGGISLKKKLLKFENC